MENTNPRCPLCYDHMEKKILPDSTSVQEYLGKVQIKAGSEIQLFSCPSCKVLLITDVSNQKEETQCKKYI